MAEEAVIIDLIQHYPFLYDESLKDHKHNLKKDNAWKAMAAALQLSETDIQRTWKLLRDRFSKERRSLKQAPSGSAIVESGWPLFKSMLLLEKHVATRRRATNVDQLPPAKRQAFDPNRQVQNSPEPSPSCSTQSTSFQDGSSGRVNFGSEHAIRLVQIQDEDEGSEEGETYQEQEEDPDQLASNSSASVSEPAPTPIPARPIKRSAAVAVPQEVTKALDGLTTYLSAKQKPCKNLAFGQFVGLTLADMPTKEQNYKKLKIMDILNENFE